MTNTRFLNATSSYSPLVLSLLRFVAGLIFMEHGTQKLLNFPVSEHGTVALFSLIGLAGALELVLGLAVTVGLFTRVAAFILSGEMAFAYFMAHFPRSLFPALNGGDAAILFCFVFLYLAFAGGGPIGLDGKFFRKS
jgi:putative oxidoreductase